MLKPSARRCLMKACTVGVHGLARRRTVSPTRTTGVMLLPIRVISSSLTCGASHSRKRGAERPPITTVRTATSIPVGSAYGWSPRLSRQRAEVDADVEVSFRRQPDPQVRWDCGTVASGRHVANILAGYRLPATARLCFGGGWPRRQDDGQR